MPGRIESGLGSEAPTCATRASKGTVLNHFTADASGALGGPKWLARRRAEAFERFVATAFPDESKEVWRYSGIDRFDIEAFAPVSSPDLESDPSSDVALAESLTEMLGPRAALVVTRDGVVRSVSRRPGVDDEDEDELRIFGVRSGWKDEQAPESLGGLARPHDAFGEMHEAFLADALLVDVAPKAVFSDPVVVVHLVSAAHVNASDGRGGVACFPRTVVRVGRSGQAGLIEMFATAGAGDDAQHAALVVPVTEMSVCEDAHLDYANLQVLGSGSQQIALQTSRVDQHGYFRSFTAGLGGRYARVRTDSELAGQGAESALLAAYLGTGDQVHDFRTLQEHHGRRSRSELLFKGAVADCAHSVYSGLIRIVHGAHGSDAFQTNHNLVLSEGAHADSVPNLDIDENDVRCSHASTVGPIDEEQLYYLESRGIEPDIAKRLIVLGFFSDLASRAPFRGVGGFLEAAVRDHLAGRDLSRGPVAVSPGAPTDGMRKTSPRG